MNSVKFEAEIREFKAKKLITNDKEIIVTLNTGDKNLDVFELAKVPPDTTVQVEITW